ncbi:MAG: FecR family protein [Gammaproteobacteria bacterium]|nr:FecR family protein [Gammaproteobacteria bacterium]
MISAISKLIPAAFASAILAISAANAAVEIEHEPIDESPAGTRIELSAEITDEDNDIELVRAYFKVPEASDYVFAAMQPLADEENTYTGQLPAPAQDTTAIDYFLLVRNGDGEVVKSQNFSIEVSADKERAAELAALPPRDVVLQPSEFADVEGFHGRLLRMAGDVEVVDADGDALSPADVGFVVRESQTIRTGTDGMAVVDFEQNPITVLDHNSRLNVRTPTWFTHLAGKAYFAFQRLLGVSQQERVVANTVALIGIRGTTFISYEEQLQGVALKEGTVNVASSADAPMQVTRNGVSAAADEYLLQPERMATFDGANVADTDFSAAVLADFARLEGFAAGLLGAAVVAQQQQSRVEVSSESSNFSAQLTGFDDFITLNSIPESAALGIGAASSTVVASAGGLGTAATVGLIAGGAVGVAAIADSGGSDSGGSTSTPTPPDSGPPVFEGSGDVTCRSCTILVIDSNAIQDDFYDLYVNDSLVGPVNNAPGATTTHTINLQPGPNTVELRLTQLQGSNTFLTVSINDGEFSADFGGSNDHIWTINSL